MIADYFKLSTQGLTELLASFNTRKSKHVVRLVAEIRFGDGITYAIRDNRKVLLETPDLKEAVEFYNNLYVEYKN